MPMSDKEAAAAAVASTPFEVPARKQFDAGVGIRTDAGDIAERAQEEAALMPKPSLSEGFEAALRLETIIDSAAKSYVGSTFDTDPNFQYTPELWQEVTRGIPTEHHKHFMRARSENHARWISGNIAQELADQQTLARLGGTGLGLRIGTALLDPAQAIIALATGPIGISAKATRLQNVFRSGLAAGTTNAAIEGYLASNQATRDGTEVFEAGLLGFLIGAPIGALTKVENQLLRDIAAKGHEQSLLGRVEGAADTGVTLTEAGKKALVNSRGTPIEQSNYWMKQIEDNRASAAERSAREAGLNTKGVAPSRLQSEHAENLRAKLRSTAARDDFLKRIESAPEEGLPRAELDEHADFLLHGAFNPRASGPTAMERAFARAVVRQSARSAKAAQRAAQQAQKDAKSAAFDAAEAADTAAKKQQVEAAYAQRELQDADLVPTTVGAKSDSAQNIRQEAPTTANLGRQFARGDVVWFEKGDELISGKVEGITANGKVMVKDDDTGKVVGFHPDIDDPAGEYSGILQKGPSEPTSGPFKAGSVGSGQTDDVDVGDTAKAEIKIGRFRIPIRFDYFAIFMRSGNVALRKLAVATIADAVGFADKALTRGLTATETAEMLRLRYEKRFLTAFEDGFHDYYKRVGTPLQSGKLRNQFADAVTFIVRGDTEAARNIPEAAKAVAEVRAVHKELLEAAQKHGVDGAEHIDTDPFYMMRKFNHDRIRMIKDKFDAAAIKQLIAGAIRSSRPDIKEELLEKIAGGYWDTIRRLPYRQELSDAAFGPKQFFTLRKELEGKLDSDTIDDVIEMIAGRTLKTEGDHPRLKARTQLDELYTADVRTKDGQLERLSIADLFINDSRLLMRQYTRQMSGLVGFARAGIRSEADWTRRIDEVLEEAEAKSQNSEKIKKHIGYMNDIRNYTLGRPMADQSYSTTDRVLRVLRDVNFMRNMGQAGFAQIPEIGNLLGLAGVRAFTMHIPEFGDLIRHAGARTLDDEFARDLINMGLGGEHLALKPNLREMDEWAFDRQLSTIERWTEKGKHLTANIGGLAAMNDMLHTLASKAFTQKFSDYAQGITKLKKADLARLNWAGIGEDNIDGIFKRLREFTELGENGRVTGIKWEEWQRVDPDSFDTFNLAVMRESRKAIQQATIGETSPWMHTKLGKMLTQFRTFTLVAWAKQGLHNIHYADASTLVAWNASVLFAGAAYVAQNSLNFAHNDEQLRKRLASEEIAKAAFQRSGFGAAIAPIADTVAIFTVGEPLFAYGRTTGLGTGFLVGNPTVDLVSSKMLGTLQNASRSVFDDEHMWTRKDVKNGLSLFLPNYFLIRNFVDATSNEFPTRNFLEQRDPR